MKNFKKTFRTALLLFPALFLITTLDNTAGNADDTAGVKIMRKEMIGEYLADDKGLSLYSFAKDDMNSSNCLEGCAVNWPPFYSDLSLIGEGLDAGNFATITRTDGQQQTTYKGRPLYYFTNDTYPGDTFGRGLGNSWFLVSPQ